MCYYSTTPTSWVGVTENTGAVVTISLSSCLHLYMCLSLTLDSFHPSSAVLSTSGLLYLHVSLSLIVLAFLLHSCSHPLSRPSLLLPLPQSSVLAFLANRSPEAWNWNRQLVTTMATRRLSSLVHGGAVNEAYDSSLGNEAQLAKLGYEQGT